MAKPTIEDQRCLIVRAEALQLLDFNIPGDYQYRTTEGVQVCIVVGDQPEGEPTVELVYTPRGSSQSVCQVVRIVGTSQHFGGQRLWFICPRTGSRCGALYAPAGTSKFLSRRAFGLKYVSQRLGRVQRLMHRARKLHEALGGDGLALGQSPLLLVKPKRKWRERWWRRVDRWKAADLMAQMALFRLR